MPPGPSLLSGLFLYTNTIKDLDREDDTPSHIQQAPFPEVFELKKKEDAERLRTDRRRKVNLQKHGFEVEHSGEILF